MMRQPTNYLRRVSSLIFLSLLAFGAVTRTGLAQELHQESKLSDTDVRAIAAIYTELPRAEMFATLKAKLPKAVLDASFRQGVRAQIPQEFIKYELKDKALEDAVAKLFSPVVDALGRTGGYDIVVLDHDVPLVMVDTDSVIVVTTGWLRRLRSDDAAQGYIAHEIGHRLFERRMRDARQKYELVQNSATGRLLMQSGVFEMARIELECDGFAGVVVSALGYDVMEFAHYMESLSQEFNSGWVAGHPAMNQRIAVLEMLADKSAKPRVSENLINIRKL